MPKRDIIVGPGQPYACSEVTVGLQNLILVGLFVITAIWYVIGSIRLARLVGAPGRWPPRAWQKVLIHGSPDSKIEHVRRSVLMRMVVAIVAFAAMWTFSRP
jgi:hypothetical protein